MSGQATLERAAVWFDFGGVLTPPVSVTVAAFCKRVGASREMLLTAMTIIAKRYGTDDIMEPLDTPLVSEADWALEMQSEVRERFSVEVDLSDFGDKWFTERAPNTLLVDFLRSLRARGHFVGMLSNMVPSWDTLWRKMVPAELFDDLVLSFQVNTRKPRREVYDLAAARAAAAPGACILIDDLEQNCDGARRAGWHAVRYRDDDARAIAETEALLASILG